MTSGAYLLADGVVERFSSGAGPAGWRYTAVRERPGSRAEVGRLDVVLHADGQVLRAEVATAGWVLRGGAVGPDLLWRRGGDEHTARAHGFTGSSPVWALAAARRTGRTPQRLRLVLLGDEALGTRVVEQAWTPGADREDGVLAYDVADLQTGERAAVHLAGDLVLLTGGAELVALDLP